MRSVDGILISSACKRHVRCCLAMHSAFGMPAAKRRKAAMRRHGQEAFPFSMRGAAAVCSL